MALIKYIAPAAEISGTIGGVTYARVRGKFVARTWRAPVNRRTDLQLNQRLLVANASKVWFETLSQLNRDGWDTYAATVTFVDSLGDNYTLTGYNMFMRSMLVFLMLTGNGAVCLPPIIPPATPGLPTPAALTYVFTHATGVLQVTASAPAHGAGQATLITVKRYIPISRAFPAARRVARAHFDNTDGLPKTIHTYAPTPPGIAGEYKAIIITRFYDDEERTSNPLITTQLSV